MLPLRPCFRSCPTLAQHGSSPCLAPALLLLCACPAPTLLLPWSCRSPAPTLLLPCFCSCPAHALASALLFPYSCSFLYSCSAPAYLLLPCSCSAPVLPCFCPSWPCSFSSPAPSLLLLLPTISLAAFILSSILQLFSARREPPFMIHFSFLFFLLHFLYRV